MDKVWLQSYPAGIPAEIDPDVYSSLNEFFNDIFAKYSDLIAFTNMGSHLSYARIGELSLQFATFLQNVLHLNKGDRFAIMLPNILQFPVVLIGALRAGLIVVNVNPLYTEREISHQLADSEAKAIIVLANFASNLEKALPHTQVEQVVVTEIGDLFAQPKAWLVNNVVKHLKKMVPTYHIPKAYTFWQAIQAGKQFSFQKVTTETNDIAFLQYTGGTTGVAKGAILTHRNMLANMEQAAAWIKDEMLEKQEVIITALPLYHIFSLLANLLVFLKLGAQNILITNPRDNKAFVKLLTNTRFTAITGVNTLFNALLNNPKFKDANFKDLKLTLGGGMAVQEEVARKWREVTGVALIAAFGLTETSPAVCINPIKQNKFNGSIGLPLPSTIVAIKNDQGENLPFGEIGELCVKGPQVMQGYWHQQEETKLVFTPDGWLLTGDLAYIDEQGYVYIVDRKKDMILVSGFNVYPNEVESVLVTHPNVFEAAVIGIPNPPMGEKVKAFIVPRGKSISVEELDAYCRGKLAAYKVPREYEFCKELPKTAVGKILRRALREPQSLS